MDPTKLAARTVSAVVLSLCVAIIGTAAAPHSPPPRPIAVQPDPAAAVPEPTFPDTNPVPDGGRAPRPADPGEQFTIWDLPPGTLVLNPVSGRREILDPAVARSAVLFGDSQSSGAAGVAGADTWVQSALADRGYNVDFKGAAGTGFVAGTDFASNYPDAVESGRVVLPYGKPALVVVQGGGNDAAHGATDAQILDNAERLLRDLKASYPASGFLFIGTLTWGARSADRRVQVNELLAGFARRNGVAFISPEGWIARYGVGDSMADNVHLAAGGHQVLSRVLAGTLAGLGLAAPGG